MVAHQRVSYLLYCGTDYEWFFRTTIFVHMLSQVKYSWKTRERTGSGTSATAGIYSSWTINQTDTQPSPTRFPSREKAMKVAWQQKVPLHLFWCILSFSNRFFHSEKTNCKYIEKNHLKSVARAKTLCFHSWRTFRFSEKVGVLYIYYSLKMSKFLVLPWQPQTASDSSKQNVSRRT